MKHILFIVLLLSFAPLGFGQNVGIGTASPDASAKVDIQSTNSGILIPRMTTAQRTAIATPATGLLVFDNTTSSFWYYDGTVWIELTSNSSLELVDTDGDTKVQVEESADEDMIRFDLAGTEHFVMDGPRLEVLNSGSSVFIGESAGQNDDLTGGRNTFVGHQAGMSNVNGGFNSFFGEGAGLANTGSSNSFFGRLSGRLNTSGDQNTFIGYRAGDDNTTGTRNVALGYLANVSSSNLTNAIAIGYNSTVSASNSLVLGNSVNVGIGTSAPQTKLHIEDSGPTIIRISSTTSSEGIQFLSPGAGSGALTDWSLISGGSSLQLGYSYDDFAGGSVLANFYDNGDVQIGSGMVGIGIYPQEKLHVDGGLRIGNTTNTAAGNIRWTGFDYEGYDGTAWRSFTADQTILEDADGDTKVQVEKNPDEDIIRFDLAGTEHFVMDGPRLEVMNSGTSVFIGQSAGQNDDLSSNENVFVGHYAGKSNIIGNSNTFVGFKSGQSNSTGSMNTYIGYLVGGNTNTSNNTFVGALAGGNNLTGTQNVFIGTRAGSANTSGDFNVAVGTEASRSNINGDSITTIGYQAGYYNAANNNAFLGFQSGYSNSGGTKNTFVGSLSGRYNTSGGANSFFGFQSGKSTTTGSANTFLGFFSGQTNTTGHDNTFVGASAGRFNTIGHSNAFIGNGAGYNNVDGNFNTFMGRDVGLANTTGNNNTFIGYRSGFNNTASNNLFMGYQAGYNNTSGDANSFLGIESGWSTTTGSANTFLGFYSGQDNTTGHDNTFIGASAGRFNTTGHSNAFVGNGAGVDNVDGNYNTAMGRTAGHDNTTGNNNTSIGYGAGYKNTVSNNNFFGYRAGYNTTTGVSNTFLGNVSGHANTTGHDNAFVGSASGMNNTTGHSNVFLGPGAGYQNQTGNYNVYIGRDAGLNGTTGTGNVFIGYQAGMNEAGNDKLYIDNSNTTSPLIYGDFNSDIAAINGNLGVGDITPAATLTVGNGDKFQVDGTNGDVLFTDDQASITFPAATASAAPMIQLFASGTTNPTRMVLAHSSTWSNYGLQYQDAGDEFHFLSGGTRVVTIDLTGAGKVGIDNENPAYDLHLANNSAAKPTSNAWTVPSDARLKKDVHDFDDGLAEILKIRPVTYTYTGEAGLPQDTGVGIIAQELKEVAPYMVSTWTYEGEEADSQEYYAVDNGAMTYMLINAIQEQQKLIEQLQQQVEYLRNDR